MPIGQHLRPPRTAVLCADGFLGQHLLEAYRVRGLDPIGTTRRAGCGGRLAHFDLAQPDVGRLRLAEAGCRQAVIAGAIANIGRCQREPERARAVNVEGTLSAAAQLAAAGVRPIVFSSDYVFDGMTGGYDDDAPRGPLNVYGATKAELERRLPEATAGNYLLIRLSKVFGETRGDGTLLDEMAARLRAGLDVAAASDQVFCPTHVADVVEAVVRLQAAGATGLFNVCSPQRWSRYDVAVAMAHALGVGTQRVRRISLVELNEDFARPRRTDMVCRRLSRTVSVRFRPLSKCLAVVASQYPARKECA